MCKFLGERRFSLPSGDTSVRLEFLGQAVTLCLTVRGAARLFPSSRAIQPPRPRRPHVLTDALLSFVVVFNRGRAGGREVVSHHALVRTSLWPTTLRAFSRAYWPFVNPLWSRVFQPLYPFLNWVVRLFVVGLYKSSSCIVSTGLLSGS